MGRIVGITGGIGSGKSVVCRLLKVMGYRVYDSDFRASELMVCDRRIVCSLTSLLGAEAYCGDGRLNRGYVATKIFADAALLEQVNRIVHPIVLEDMVLWIARGEDTFVFVESAILLSSVLRDRVDCVVSVVSDRALRIDRVQKRSGLAISEIEDRMDVQFSDEAMIALSDYVVYNNDRRSLIEQVVVLVDCLTQSRSKVR